jgi:general secretion pathway protein N
LTYLRRSLIGLGLLLLAAGLLVWFLPARWALARIDARLHGLRLQDVHGLLWDGRAGRVLTADGRLIGQLQWQLSRRALLGQVHLRLSVTGPQLSFSGIMQQSSASGVTWSDVQLHAGLDALPAVKPTPIGQPRGSVQVSVPLIRLQGGWPMQLQAQARWQPAIVRSGGRDMPLGALLLTAQAQAGVITLQLHDDGHGPLQARAQALLSPLGWRLQATLLARAPAPGLRHWLATLGPAAADGSVHIERSGGLAAAAATSPMASPMTSTEPAHAR